MEEKSNQPSTPVKIEHNVPKCTSCGSIGAFKTEPIFTPLYLMIGIGLILFWIVPKPANIINDAVMFILDKPLLMSFFVGVASTILMFIPGFKIWSMNVFSTIFGFISDSTGWNTALIIGLVYFGIIFIARHNKNKREKVCKNCKAINRYTFIY